MSAGETDGVGDLVMQTARAVRRRWSGVLEPWDLSPHHARALRGIGDGVRLSELAAFLRIAPRSATEVVDGLEERGLARRVPDPRDRRAVLVEPTAEGRRIREAVESARAADLHDYFGALSAEERETLVRILRRLHPADTSEDALQRPRRGRGRTVG